MFGLVVVVGILIVAPVVWVCAATPAMAADRAVMRDAAARYGGAPTHATISSGTTILNGFAATFSFTTAKESWWIRNGSGGRIYYRFDADACTRQTSHGYLDSGESIAFNTMNTKVTVLNAGASAVQYDTSTKDLWIVAWD